MDVERATIKELQSSGFITATVADTSLRLLEYIKNAAGERVSCYEDVVIMLGSPSYRDKKPLILVYPLTEKEKEKRKESGKNLVNYYMVKVEEYRIRFYACPVGNKAPLPIGVAGLIPQSYYSGGGKTRGECEAKAFERVVSILRE